MYILFDFFTQVLKSVFLLHKDKHICEQVIVSTLSSDSQF